MSDRLPSQPAAQLRAQDLLEAGSLQPDTAGLLTAMPQHVSRGVNMLLATNMISVGIGQNRLGLLYSIGARLHDMAKVPWLINQPKDHSSPPQGLDIVRVLLRTSEETSGIPCSVSGLPHGLEPTPATALLVIIDESHQLSGLKSVIHLAVGSGKTAITARLLVEQLTQRMGRLNRRDQRPSAAELGQIADAAYALSKLLLLLAQRLLTEGVKFVGYLAAVPPTESAPCGLLRLAAPRLPRAPGVRQVPGPIEFALAA
ncbi:hypothetical protein ACIRO1_25605 [Streptomyces sp. NPDC102381]|uniref:hypothetical protein n=1 Tax=Streptomyces sp. NPDC102381 TaxID=3366164 RepID=UPI003810CA56